MDILTPAVLQPLGVSAVLAVFLWLSWSRLKDKDERINTITDKLQEKYSENTAMIERVNSSIQQNNRLMEKVLNDIDGVMRQRNS